MTSARGPLPTITKCGQAPAVRPARIVLACADRYDMVKGISWSGWGTTAQGRGVEWYDDCVPRSACGLDAHRPARVVLGRVVDGRFTRLRVYAGGHVREYELPD